MGGAALSEIWTQSSNCRVKWLRRSGEGRSKNTRVCWRQTQEKGRLWFIPDSHSFVYEHERVAIPKVLQRESIQKHGDWVERSRGRVVLIMLSWWENRLLVARAVQATFWRSLGLIILWQTQAQKTPWLANKWYWWHQDSSLGLPTCCVLAHCGNLPNFAVCHIMGWILSP